MAEVAVVDTCCSVPAETDDTESLLTEPTEEVEDTLAEFVDDTGVEVSFMKSKTTFLFVFGLIIARALGLNLSFLGMAVGFEGC